MMIGRWSERFYNRMIMIKVERKDLLPGDTVIHVDSDGDQFGRFGSIRLANGCKRLSTVDADSHFPGSRPNSGRDVKDVRTRPSFA